MRHGNKFNWCYQNEYSKRHQLTTCIIKVHFVHKIPFSTSVESNTSYIKNTYIFLWKNTCEQLVRNHIRHTEIQLWKPGKQFFTYCWNCKYSEQEWEILVNNNCMRWLYGPYGLVLCISKRVWTIVEWPHPLKALLA